MSSKALALLVQGIKTLSEALSLVAEDLQEGAEKTFILDQVKTAEQEIKAGEKPAAGKKEVAKETKNEAASEIDYAKIREECRTMVGDLCLALKKPDVVALLKKHGVAGVSEAHCPDATKLPAIHAELKPMMTPEVLAAAKKAKDAKK